MRRFAFAAVITLLTAQFGFAQDTSVTSQAESTTPPWQIADEEEAGPEQVDGSGRGVRPTIKLDVTAEPATTGSPSDRPLHSRPQYGPEQPRVETPHSTGSRYDTRKDAIRRRAELKAAHRRARIEANKWYGYSPLRPATSPLPQMGYGGPSVGGAGWYTYRWLSPLPYAADAVFQAPTQYR